MTEPFAQFGTVDELGLPAPLAAMVARAEAREIREEQRAEAERLAVLEDRAEARLHNWMVQRALQLAWEGKAFDLSRPETMLETPDQQATRVFALEDAETARAERRQAIRDGRLHLLNVPASEMSAVPPSAEELAEEQDDMEATRARYRTEHAGLAAKIRRALRGKVTR